MFEVISTELERVLTHTITVLHLDSFGYKKRDKNLLPMPNTEAARYFLYSSSMAKNSTLGLHGRPHPATDGVSFKNH